MVARKDRKLIERFDYQFEQVEHTESVIEFFQTQSPTFHPGFRKLRGNAKNFLLIHSNIDVSRIQNKLGRLPQEAWLNSGREERYAAHRNTQALRLIYDEDFRHNNPTYHPRYGQFEDELRSLVDRISNYYGGDGFVVRLIFASLLGHQEILLHRDKHYSLINCHRVHIPIVTNELITFTVGGEEKKLREGELWEIDNSTFHAVTNDGDEDRIHLIIDWVPNGTLPEEDRMTATALGGSRSSNLAQSSPEKVGRNVICPCGSGKRYKHCHGLAA